MEAYPAHRGDEQRPGNLHKPAQWGNRRRHRLVPDARVAGQGASRGALLIPDQWRLRCAASNGGPCAEAHARPPWTRRRGVPPSRERYSRADVRAVECSRGLPPPKARGITMRQGCFVIPFALGYIGLLFGGASCGDRPRRFGREGGWRHFIYPLSLAIYCTSWTFFGSVGLASRTGFD